MKIHPIFLFVFMLAIAMPLDSYAHGKEIHESKNSPEKENDSHVSAMEEVRLQIPEAWKKLQLPDWVGEEDKAGSGETIYNNECASCHGESGKGDGPMADELDSSPADFTDKHHAAFFTVGERYWVTTYGMKKLGMPAFKDSLTDEERWSAIAHILKFNGSDK